jgi:putative tryptophan/tyrosine transport system substrate-binding protein
MPRMGRREVITALGGMVATSWPPAARAQQRPQSLPRIGCLVAGAAEDQEARARHNAFRDSLEKLGWIDGRAISIDYRWGSRGQERTQAGVTELIGLAPRAILSEGTPNTQALQAKTRSIPIVFVAATDPLSSGLVRSMARPGGNVTGFTNYEFPMGAKWLEVLKEAAPGIKRVLVIASLPNAGQQGFLQALEAAAPTLGVQPVKSNVANASDIERAINGFAEQPNGGLVMLPGSAGLYTPDLIVGLAARHRLPAIYPYRSFIAKGALMSYDTDIADLFRRAASYIDRILRGEKPGDLPVQVPTKYDLVINLKVARALGLVVPLQLLSLADEVIE